MLVLDQPMMKTALSQLTLFLRQATHQAHFVLNCQHLEEAVVVEEQCLPSL